MVSFEKKGLRLMAVVFFCALGIRISNAASLGSTASGSLDTITKNLNQAYQSLGGSSSSNAQDGSSAQGAFPELTSAINNIIDSPNGSSGSGGLKDVESWVNNMIFTAKNLKEVGNSQDPSSLLQTTQEDWKYVKGDWNKIQSDWQKSSKAIQVSLDSSNTNLDSAKNLFVPVGTDLGAINRALEAFKSQSSDAFASASRDALKRSRDDIAARRNNLLSRQSKYGQASGSFSSVQQGLDKMIKEGYHHTFAGILSGRIESECLKASQSGGNSASKQFEKCVQDLKSYKKSVKTAINNLGKMRKDLNSSREQLLTKP